MSQSGSFLAGGGGSNVLTLTGNSGGAVGPTGGNINVVGSGFLSVVGNPGTSTLTISDSGLTALQGDTGSTTTASTVIIDFSDCGATTTTVSGANNVTFKVTSLVNNNTFVGHNSGGSVNLAVATQNTCFGQEALDRITTGSFNLAFGYRAGHNYTGAENSNLTIGNNLLGTTGESGVIRLGGGNSGGSKTFIAGITGITPVNAGALVNIIDSAGQLGTITNGTSGFVLTSNGGGTNPSFQASPSSSISITGDTGGALTGNAFTFTGGTTGIVFNGAGTTETLGGTLVVSNGGTGQATLTNHGLLVGAGTAAITQLGVATNGQLPIGSVGADPVLATLTAGTGISISNGAGTITIATTGPASFTWSVITVNQTAAVNNGYICNKAGTLALLLPAASVVGDELEVTGINTALGWQITQAAGQQIFFGNTQTTAGGGGTLTSSATRDSIRMVCIVANLTWQVLSSVGNITVV